MNREKEFIQILKSEITPSLGCTEPIAVAYSVAVAKKQVKGKLESINIRVDPYLYKNALNVGIPGTDKRGIYIAAALGYLVGDSDKKFEVIKNSEPDDVKKAEELINKKKINVTIDINADQLLIETVLKTNKEKVKVVTLHSHLNIEEIQINEQVTPIKENSNKNDDSIDKIKFIQSCTLNEMKEFVDKVSLKEIMFLKEGIILNKIIAEEGLKIDGGVGKALFEMVEKGIAADTVIKYAQILTSSAAEARMSGSKKSVMSSTGSGNQGITIFLTLAAFAERKNLKEKNLLRALALANLIAIYNKSYLGSLSCMCGAAIAAGPGVSAGIVYLMNGDIQKILGAILNMFGSITGTICDGAKEGCAYKVALTASWAIESAFLSLNGAIVNHKDGILSDDFGEAVKKLAYVNNPGMVPTNKAILKMMQKI